MSDYKRPERQLGIQMPMRMIEQLEQIARREGNNISTVVRRLLTAQIERELAKHQ